MALNGHQARQHHTAHQIVHASVQQAPQHCAAAVRQQRRRQLSAKGRQQQARCEQPVHGVGQLLQVARAQQRRVTRPAAKRDAHQAAEAQLQHGGARGRQEREGLHLVYQ